MNENETQSTVESVSATETTTTPVASEKTVKKSSKGKYVAAFVAVVVIILGALYLLEKEGRSSTTIFASLIESQRASAIVAVVNGTEIVNSQLDISINQFSQAAAAQGVDLTNPIMQSEIRNQALDVLINTELLKQAAAERGMSVTEQDADARFETIKTDIGGDEVLVERMAALGITEDKLRQDIRDELLIQQLLDQVFLDAGIEVTDEEIAEVYDNAGGEEAGLPALDDVKDQVIAQIKASKEQAAIDQYLTELKGGANIDIKTEG